VLPDSPVLLQANLALLLDSLVSLLVNPELFPLPIPIPQAQFPQDMLSRPQVQQALTHLASMDLVNLLNSAFPHAV